MFCLKNCYQLILICVLFFGAYAYGESNSEVSETLRMVSIFFRHGERNPETSFPTDPNFNYSWPGGYGALVPKGALNLLNVGIKLRDRYYSLIPQNDFYNENVIKVRSSEYDRCLMSGASFLAGFMPPKESLNILPLPWQPIPINSLPKAIDYYIFPLAPCPVFDRMYASINSPDSEYYEETYGQFADILKILGNYTGQRIIRLTQIENLYYMFQIQQSAGLEIPKWSDSFYPEKLLEIVKVSSRLNTITPWMKKIKGGPIITQILDIMNAKKMKTLNPDRSIFIYSGHDHTLKNIMNTIGLFPAGEVPEFGATLAFELHDNNLICDNDLEIRIIYYNDGYAIVPQKLTIPNCGEPCSLSKFTELMEPYIIRNIEEICAAP